MVVNTQCVSYSESLYLVMRGSLTWARFSSYFRPSFSTKSKPSLSSCRQAPSYVVTIWFAGYFCIIYPMRHLQRWKEKINIFLIYSIFSGSSSSCPFENLKKGNLFGTLFYYVFFKTQFHGTAAASSHLSIRIIKLRPL